MRVLAVTNMYPTSLDPATGTYVEQQVKGLQKIGVEVDVLFVERRRRGMGVYLRLPEMIRSRLQTFRADFVHVMYGGVLADVTTRVVRDRPTIVTFHGSDLLGENLSGEWRKWIARYGVASSRKAARRARGVVVVGEALLKTLPREVDLARVRVIPCGIDVDRFRPLDRERCRQQIGWRDGRFHVLFNSHGADPVKRPELARAAVAELNRTGIPTEMHELHGVANADVPVWLNASDVLLLTSLHEGSPTIVKEALACNLPVVSLDVGDVRERMQGIDGCYLALADPEDLAAKLRLVQAGPRRVNARPGMEELSIERIAVRLKHFYDELTAVGRRHDRMATADMKERLGDATV